MFCYISFVIEGHDTKFLCELCEKEIQGPEILLKLHQIGLHLQFKDHQQSLNKLLIHQDLGNLLKV